MTGKNEGLPEKPYFFSEAYDKALKSESPDIIISLIEREVWHKLSEKQDDWSLRRLGGWILKRSVDINKLSNEIQKRIFSLKDDPTERALLEISVAKLRTLAKDLSETGIALIRQRAIDVKAALADLKKRTLKGAKAYEHIIEKRERAAAEYKFEDEIAYNIKLKNPDILITLILSRLPDISDERIGLFLKEVGNSIIKQATELREIDEDKEELYNLERIAVDNVFTMGELISDIGAGKVKRTFESYFEMLCTVKEVYDRREPPFESESPYFTS
jgi:hypothetical protein